MEGSAVARFRKLLVGLGCLLLALFCLRALLLWKVQEDAWRKLGIPPKASFCFRVWASERIYQRNWLKTRLPVGTPRERVIGILPAPDTLIERGTGGYDLYIYRIGWAGKAEGSDIFIYLHYDANDWIQRIHLDNS